MRAKPLPFFLIGAIYSIFCLDDVYTKPIFAALDRNHNPVKTDLILNDNNGDDKQSNILHNLARNAAQNPELKKLMLDTAKDMMDNNPDAVKTILENVEKAMKGNPELKNLMDDFAKKSGDNPDMLKHALELNKAALANPEYMKIIQDSSKMMQSPEMVKLVQDSLKAFAQRPTGMKELFERAFQAMDQQPELWKLFEMTDKAMDECPELRKIYEERKRVFQSRPEMRKTMLEMYKLKERPEIKGMFEAAEKVERDWMQKERKLTSV